MTEADIQAEAARRVMSMTSLSASDRRAARARIEGELRAEASAKAAAVAAATAKAEAAAERTRVASVVREGQRVGRARQAVRLALTGPLDAAGARAVLTTLPPDLAAPAASLAVPDATSFGTAAAQAERSRIAAILGHPEAAGREATASALAFETGLDPATAAVALAGVARAVAYAGLSLAERSAAAGDFGHQAAVPGGHRPSGAAALWSKAIAELNAGIEGGGEALPPGAQTEAERSAELFAQVERWRVEEGR